MLAVAANKDCGSDYGMITSHTNSILSVRVHNEQCVRGSVLHSYQVHVHQTHIHVRAMYMEWIRMVTQFHKWEYVTSFRPLSLHSSKINMHKYPAGGGGVGRGEWVQGCSCTCEQSAEH